MDLSFGFGFKKLTFVPELCSDLPLDLQTAATSTQAFKSPLQTHCPALVFTESLLILS